MPAIDDSAILAACEKKKEYILSNLECVLISFIQQFEILPSARTRCPARVPSIQTRTYSYTLTHNRRNSSGT